VALYGFASPRPGKDLDAYLELHNTKRPHRGRSMDGRTPYRMFKAGLKEAKTAATATPKKEDKQAA
jgi:hypothetical protein